MLFFHSKHESNRVTIAGEFCEEGLCLTAARCSDNDNFCRKTGREITERRFNIKRTCITLPIEDKSYKTFVSIARSFADLVSENIKFKKILKETSPKTILQELQKQIPVEA